MMCFKTPLLVKEGRILPKAEDGVVNSLSHLLFSHFDTKRAVLICALIVG
jgi:hypothetical protein